MSAVVTTPYLAGTCIFCTFKHWSNTAAYGVRGISTNGSFFQLFLFFVWWLSSSHHLLLHCIVLSSAPRRYTWQTPHFDPFFRPPSPSAQTPVFVMRASWLGVLVPPFTSISPQPFHLLTLPKHFPLARRGLSQKCRGSSWGASSFFLFFLFLLVLFLVSAFPLLFPSIMSFPLSKLTRPEA